jgi:hypothetical protein
VPADQKPQRLDLASQAATACQKYIDALHTLQDLAERRPHLGNFQDSDFVGTDLAYLDAATIGSLFDFVVPDLSANYTDAANSGRNKQILNQVAKTL